MNAWTKGTASIDDDHNPDVECYYDNTTWNGWDNVALTRNGIAEWLDSSPYDYRFIVKNRNPAVVIYFEDEITIESSPLWNGQEFEEVYFIDDYCFVIKN